MMESRVFLHFENQSSADAILAALVTPRSIAFCKPSNHAELKNEKRAILQIVEESPRSLGINRRYRKCPASRKEQCLGFPMMT